MGTEYLQWPDNFSHKNFENYLKFVLQKQLPPTGPLTIKFSPNLFFVKRPQLSNSKNGPIPPGSWPSTGCIDRGAGCDMGPSTSQTYFQGFPTFTPFKLSETFCVGFKLLKVLIKNKILNWKMSKRSLQGFETYINQMRIKNL